MTEPLRPWPMSPMPEGVPCVRTPVFQPSAPRPNGLEVAYRLRPRYLGLQRKNDDPAGLKKET